MAGKYTPHGLGSEEEEFMVFTGNKEDDFHFSNVISLSLMLSYFSEDTKTVAAPTMVDNQETGKQTSSNVDFKTKSTTVPDELECRTSVLFGISRDVVYNVTVDRTEEHHYQNLSLAILQMLCKRNGLKIVGKKDSLVKRLLNPRLPSSKKLCRPPLSDNRVGWILAKAGVGENKFKGNCMKRAIQRGYVPFDGVVSLNKVIVKGLCQDCGCEVEGTIGELLNQPDNGIEGVLNEKGAGATVKCKNKVCLKGHYVKNMCIGEFEFDAKGGRGHNHCTWNSGFGQCVDKYITVHNEKAHQQHDKQGISMEWSESKGNPMDKCLDHTAKPDSKVLSEWNPNIQSSRENVVMNTPSSTPAHGKASMKENDSFYKKRNRDSGFKDGSFIHEHDYDSCSSDEEPSFASTPNKSLNKSRKLDLSNVFTSPLFENLADSGNAVEAVTPSRSGSRKKRVKKLLKSGFDEIRRLNESYTSPSKDSSKYSDIKPPKNSSASKDIDAKRSLQFRSHEKFSPFKDFNDDLTLSFHSGITEESSYDTYESSNDFIYESFDDLDMAIKESDMWSESNEECATSSYSSSHCGSLTYCFDSDCTF